MADVNEICVTGRKYRRILSVDDDGNKTYQRISFWHDADDIEFTDGETAQEKIDTLMSLVGSNN